MTWVKICGITNLEDALVAVEAGADAVGFVFYDKSPRKVDVDTAQAIVEKLLKPVEKVGVFVSGSDVDWFEILHRVELTAVQQVVTGDRRDETPKAVGLRALVRPLKVYTSLQMPGLLENEDQVKSLAESFKVLRRNVANGDSLPESCFDTFFLDSGRGQTPGGTGETFDWRKAMPIAEGMRQGGIKLVVAGGLNPSNVSEAIGVLQPWGVDVSSGVEARPGKKDPDKVRAFVQAVRRAEKSA